MHPANSLTRRPEKLVIPATYRVLHGARHPTTRRPLRGHQRLPTGRRPAHSHRRSGAPGAPRRPQHGAAGRDRHRQERHDRLAHREAAAAGPRDRSQQDPVRSARQGVPRADAQQRGRILRQLLRLLPARGLYRADRHLHREGLVGQRGGRAAAALGHDVAAHPPRRDRGGDRQRDLRPGHAAGIPGAGRPGQGRRGGRSRQAAAPAGRHPVFPQRHGLPARHVPGPRRHARDHPGV